MLLVTRVCGYLALLFVCLNGPPLDGHRSNTNLRQVLQWICGRWASFCLRWCLGFCLLKHAIRLCCSRKLCMETTRVPNTCHHVRRPSRCQWESCFEMGWCSSEPGPVFARCSCEATVCRDLIKNILDTNPDTRYDIKHIKSHRWYQMEQHEGVTQEIAQLEPGKFAALTLPPRLPQKSCTDSMLSSVGFVCCTQCPSSASPRPMLSI